MISKDSFLSQILPITLTYEGGYTNNPLDKGGETYRGISRKNNPNWIGWRNVDLLKASGTLKTGQTIPLLESAVKDFYYSTYFQKNQFDKLNSIKVATALFDYAVHGGYNVKGLQTLLNSKFNEKLKVDGVIGSLTIAAINRANETKLLSEIMTWRKGYLNTVVTNNPSQQTFAQGWDNRITNLSSFLGVVKNNPIPTGIIVVVVCGLIYYFFIRPKTAAYELD